MNITIGERGSGKSTKLIKRSYAIGVPILTATKLRAESLYLDAKRMGLNIPAPIAVDEYLRDRDTFKYSDAFRCGLLIDDAEDVLQQIFAGIPIREVTISDMGNINWLKPISLEIHGKWITSPYCTISGPMYRCSCCGKDISYKSDYCQSCGAKMDLEENKNENT